MALGKSLGNILENYFSTTDNLTENILNTSSNQIVVRNIDIEKIKDNPFQTRTFFDQEKILSLANDIKINGLLQPIIVIEKNENLTDSSDALNQDKFYILLAGERRLRACKTLKWKSIPANIVNIKEIPESNQALIAAMENFQREDLSPIGLANTFVMLMNTQKLTDEELASMLKKSVQYIKNYIRLLTLCDEVKNLLIHKELTESQARFLIGLDENKQIKLSQRIIKEELTVKEISKLIQEINGKTKVIKKDLKLKTTHSLPSDYVKNALWLCKNIQGSVLKCQGDNAKGKIIISWG